MADSPNPRASGPRFVGLTVFLVIELLCLAGFVASLAMGDTGVGVAFLVAPIQLLVWLLLLRGGRPALIWFIALLPLAGMELLPYYYYRYAYYPAILLLITAGVSLRFLTEDRVEPRRQSWGDLVPFLLLILALVMSTINAILHGWTNPNLWFHVALLAETLCFAYFFSTIPQTTKDIGELVLTFGVMLVLTTLLIPLLPHPIGEGGVLGGKIVITPFGKSNLNTFGTFLSAGSALLLGIAFKEKRFLARTAILLGVAVLLVMLVLTKSRGAWLGFAVATVYLVMTVRSTRVLVVAAGLVAILLVSDQLRSVLLTRVGETSVRDPSLLGRLILWVYVWKVVAHNWLLGVGFDNFRLVKHIYGYPYPLWYAFRYNAHNLFMEILVDLGVIGFVGFCWTYVWTVVRLNRISRDTSGSAWGLALGLSAALVSYGAHGLFDAVLYQHGGLLLLGVLLGLGVGLVRINSASTMPDTRASRFAR